jgi:hypothetical protein
LGADREAWLYALLSVYQIAVVAIRRTKKMRWKRVKVALLAIALGVAGASFAAAVPASAATTSITEHDVPKIPNPAVRYVTFVDNTGSEIAECFNGNEDSILAPQYVSNGCTTRVWLYQYSDETGYSLCLRPNSTTGHLGREYHSFRIVSSKKSC